MANFILVHGAWYGAWCWKRLRAMLQAEGHTVYTPTLTGVGERRHLLRPDIDLQTHVDDVANIVEFDDLDDIVLVGHSYGGMIAGQVADRYCDRMRALVYLDAFVPEDGKSLLDFLPHPEMVTVGLRMEDCDWTLKPIPASVFKVNAADFDWVERQATPHPLATFTTPARLTGKGHTIDNIGYIFSEHHEGPFQPFYEAAKARGWWHQSFGCGHNIMLDDPVALFQLLSERTCPRTLARAG